LAISAWFEWSRLYSGLQQAPFVYLASFSLRAPPVRDA
jgi:hypothetical protein